MESISLKHEAPGTAEGSCFYSLILFSIIADTTSISPSRKLPSHVFSDVSTYRIKSVNKLQPSWYILVHPSHYYYHSRWISSTRFRFQQMDSLWKTLLRNVRNVFSGADTFFRCRSFLGMKGNALLKSFHSKRSYSLFSRDTQNPSVSSAITFEGVIDSCLPAICLLACVT